MGIPAVAMVQHTVEAHVVKSWADLQKILCPLIVGVHGQKTNNSHIRKDRRSPANLQKVLIQPKVQCSVLHSSLL
ncbi:hypothetical protein C8R48DRAFT_686513, partial [Suillus tomentosus]